MFNCPLHNWSSRESPCPACPTITTSSTDIAIIVPETIANAVDAVKEKAENVLLEGMKDVYDVIAQVVHDNADARTSITKIYDIINAAHDEYVSRLPQSTPIPPGIVGQLKKLNPYKALDKNECSFYVGFDCACENLATLLSKGDNKKEDNHE